MTETPVTPSEPIEMEDGNVRISWPPKIHAQTGEPIRHYPQDDKYEFQEFAGPVFEMGGYGDMTMIDPYTGRRLWVSQALLGEDWSPYQAMRKVIELAEKHDFLNS
jgi:hypothetical protein